MSGTIFVHSIEHTFRFEYRNGYVYLPGEITIADAAHRVAAQIIADELEKTVVWQSITGMKYTAYPHSGVLADISTIDPRNDNLERARADELFR